MEFTSSTQIVQCELFTFVLICCWKANKPPKLKLITELSNKLSCFLKICITSLSVIKFKSILKSTCTINTLREQFCIAWSCVKIFPLKNSASYFVSFYILCLIISERYKISACLNAFRSSHLIKFLLGILGEKRRTI